MLTEKLPDNQSSLLFEAIKSEVAKVIVGQQALVERLLVSLLADGHVLLEGVPGLAKTKILAALTKVIGAEMKRVQFTPDLLPSDLVGTEIYRPQTGNFEVRKGPVFTNLLLADEINRAPAKVQSALLQSMQEREVSIGNTTFKLPKPFMVMATQNPVEQEGTYPLPEAQLDRFLLKLNIGYPSFEEELGILKLDGQERQREPNLETVLSIDELIRLRSSAQAVFVDEKLDRYIVSLVQATRNTENYNLKGLVEFGASPRASIALRNAAKALAFVRGKDYVSPVEIKDLSHEVLRHRILLSFEADSKEMGVDEVISTLIEKVRVP